MAQQKLMIVVLFMISITTILFVVNIDTALDVIHSVTLIDDLAQGDRRVTGSALILLFIFLSVAIILSLKKGNDDDYLKYTEQNDTNPQTSNYIKIANNINIRIHKLERRSSMIYWTIIMVITSGLLLILFSGYLSSLDSYASNLWTLIEKSNPNIDKSTSSGTLSLGPRDPPSSHGAQETQNASERAFTEIRSQYMAKMITNIGARGSESKEINLNGTILRVCILGMVVFLVQILIQLYRYNSRLITFYISRRDSIIISNGEPLTMKKISDLLFPSGFDFGKEPRHPFLEAATLARIAQLNWKERQKKNETDKGGKGGAD